MLPGCGEDPAYVMPRGVRAKLFLRGLVKLIALVLVAGGVGLGLGMGLSRLAQDDAAPVTAETSGTRSTVTAAASPPATTTTTTPATQTTAAADDPPSPLAQVRVSVLDARLFTDSTPSGRQNQRARVTVRLRAENAGGQRVALARPILRVGSVRVPADATARTSEAQSQPLEAATEQTVTLRFSLAGEATPKLVRDRRARLLIAGRSVAMRLKLRASTP